MNKKIWCGIIFFWACLTTYLSFINYALLIRYELIIEKTKFRLETIISAPDQNEACKLARKAIDDLEENVKSHKYDNVYWLS